MDLLNIGRGGSLLGFLDNDEIIAKITELLPEDLRGDFATLADPDRRREFIEEKKQELIEHVPEPLRFLFDRVADFTETEVGFPELTRDASEGNATLGVSLSSSVSLVKGPVQDLRTQVPDNRVAISVMLEGEFDLTATLSGAANLLSAGLNFGREQSFRLQYVTKASPDDLMMEVVAGLRDVIVNPFDLDSIAEKVQAGDLLGVLRRRVGTTTVGLDVALSRGVASASYGVKYRDQGDFQLVVASADNGGLGIYFGKSRTRETASIFKFGVDIQVEGFKESLLARVDTLLPADNPVADGIKRLDGIVAEVASTDLNAELVGALANHWPEGGPIFENVLGGELTGTVTEKIQQEISEQVEELIGQRVDLWNDAKETALAKIIPTLRSRIAVLPVDASKLEGFLAKSIGDALDSVGAKIDAKVIEKLDADAAVAIIEPWTTAADEFGQRTREKLESLPTEAAAKLEAAIDPLKDIYKKYTDLRERIISQINERVENEISIKLTAEKQDTLTQAGDIVLVVDLAVPVQDAVQNLFKALNAGDLSQWSSLGSALEGEPYVRDFSGEYREVQQSIQKSTLGINLLGFKLSSTETFKQTNDVRIDESGVLTKAATDAERENIRTKNGESIASRSHWSLDTLNDAEPASAQIQLVFTDEKFEGEDGAEEVKDFYDSLISAGLSTEAKYMEAVSALFPPGTNSQRNVTLTVAIPVPVSFWLSLLGEGEALSKEATQKAYLAGLEKHYPGHAESLTGFAAALRRDRFGTTYAHAAALLIQISETPRIRRGRFFDGISSDDERQAKGVVKTLERLGKSVTDAQEAWTSLRGQPGTGLNPADVGNRREGLKNVNDAIAAFVRVAAFTGDIGDSTSQFGRRLSAGISMLRTLAGVAEDDLPGITFQNARLGKLKLQ